MPTSQPTAIEELPAPLREQAELLVANGEVETADATSPVAEATTPLASTESLVKELPEEVVAFLVRSTPARALWDWLSEPARTALLHSSTRGFQRTAGALRQPMVRSRLLRHLYEHPADFKTVLKLWGEATPPPHVVPEIRALTDEATLESQLPDLWHRHGAEAVLLTLMLD